MTSPHPEPPSSTATDLRDFARFLRREHLQALAEAYLAAARELELPLLRHFDGEPEARLRLMAETSLDAWLASVIDGREHEAVEAALRRWAGDALAVPRLAIVPDDVVLLDAAQAIAALGFVERYTTEVGPAVAIARALQARAAAAQRQRVRAFAAVREQAGQRGEAGGWPQAAPRSLLGRLLDAMPTGIAYLDAGLVFRWVNPLFASYAARRPEDLVGKAFHDAFPTMERPNPRLVRAIESRAVQRVVGLELQGRDGEPTFWDIVYVPVLDERGDVEGLLLLSQDATGRVRAERLQAERIDRLQEVDRMKNEFLSILSHELRTPINAIMGFASVLEDGLGGHLTATQAAYVQHISTGADLMLSLINDLLDMSRIQAGKFLLAPAPMDFAQVARRAVDGLTPLASRRSHTVAIELPPEGVPMAADAQRVAQIVVNLVGNAIKFTPPGGIITLRAAVAGDRLRCEVADTGPGIARADQDRLFQPFTQVDSSSTRMVGGTGLGLSITKALVEAHGGAIGVSSEPGLGTTFWFELPCTPT